MKKRLTRTSASMVFFPCDVDCRAQSTLFYSTVAVVVVKPIGPFQMGPFLPVSLKIREVKRTKHDVVLDLMYFYLCAVWQVPWEKFVRLCVYHSIQWAMKDHLNRRNKIIWIQFSSLCRTQTALLFIFGCKWEIFCQYQNFNSKMEACKKLLALCSLFSQAESLCEKYCTTGPSHEMNKQPHLMCRIGLHENGYLNMIYFAWLYFPSIFMNSSMKCNAKTKSVGGHCQSLNVSEPPHYLSTAVFFYCCSLLFRELTSCIHFHTYSHADFVD